MAETNTGHRKTLAKLLPVLRSLWSGIYTSSTVHRWSYLVWRGMQMLLSACRGAGTPVGAWGQRRRTRCSPWDGGFVVQSQGGSPSAPGASWRLPVRKSIHSPGKKRHMLDLKMQKKKKKMQVCISAMSLLNSFLSEVSSRGHQCCTHLNLHGLRGPAEGQDEDSDGNESSLHGDSRWSCSVVLWLLWMCSAGA